MLRPTLKTVYLHTDYRIPVYYSPDVSVLFTQASAFHLRVADCFDNQFTSQSSFPIALWSHNPCLPNLACLCEHLHFLLRLLAALTIIRRAMLSPNLGLAIGTLSLQIHIVRSVRRLTPIPRIAGLARCPARTRRFILFQLRLALTTTSRRRHHVVDVVVVVVVVVVAVQLQPASS